MAGAGGGRQGAGVFDTTFCAGGVRVARGDRGEVRVFVRAGAFEVESD